MTRQNSSNSILTDAERQWLTVSSVISTLGALTRSDSLTQDQTTAIGIALLCFAANFLSGDESLASYFSEATRKENAEILKGYFDTMLQTFYSRAKSNEVIQ